MFLCACAFVSAFMCTCVHAQYLLFSFLNKTEALPYTPSVRPWPWYQRWWACDLDMTPFHCGLQRGLRFKLGQSQSFCNLTITHGREVTACRTLELQQVFLLPLPCPTCLLDSTHHVQSGNKGGWSGRERVLLSLCIWSMPAPLHPASYVSSYIPFPSQASLRWVLHLFSATMYLALFQGRHDRQSLYCHGTYVLSEVEKVHQVTFR